MPDPGSHRHDIHRTRRRAEYDDQGAPDQHADHAAADHAAAVELRRAHPPRRVGDPERAAGPAGEHGTSRGDPGIDEPPGAVADGMALLSTAFTDHELMPDRFAYERDNVSPPLEWHQVPDGTRELALICEDPDAPGGTFVHWVVTDIPPDARGTEENALPPGAVAGRNGFGERRWSGPRPPVGDEPHRYFFRLYAVDRPLGLDDATTAAEVRATIDQHVLATGTLVGRFGR